MRLLSSLRLPLASVGERRVDLPPASAAAGVGRQRRSHSRLTGCLSVADPPRHRWAWRRLPEGSPISKKGCAADRPGAEEPPPPLFPPCWLSFRGLTQPTPLRLSPLPARLAFKLLYYLWKGWLWITKLLG